MRSSAFILNFPSSPCPIPTCRYVYAFEAKYPQYITFRTLLTWLVEYQLRMLTLIACPSRPWTRTQPSRPGTKSLSATIFPTVSTTTAGASTLPPIQWNWEKKRRIISMGSKTLRPKPTPQQRRWRAQRHRRTRPSFGTLSSERPRPRQHDAERCCPDTGGWYPSASAFQGRSSASPATGAISMVSGCLPRSLWAGTVTGSPGQGEGEGHLTTEARYFYMKW